MIDQELNFKLHFESLATGVSRVGTLLARMLINIGSPRQSLTSRVVDSILLYAVSLCFLALERKKLEFYID